MAIREIRYSLKSDDGTESRFTVSLDAETLALCLPANAGPPDWARLDYCQCPGCPLAGSAERACPMALALVDLLAFSGRLDSFSPLQVEVITSEREIRTRVPAQRAVSSLMGLLIATCACPEVAWLRPMARFHLPLASEEETLYRAVSMYLLAQYFRHQSGAVPDLSLSGLRERYQRLHQINLAMAERLRTAVGKDAPVNAVILLDLFAKAMPYTVDDSVAELEYLFRSYRD